MTPDKEEKTYLKHQSSLNYNILHDFSVHLYKHAAFKM